MNGNEVMNNFLTALADYLETLIDSLSTFIRNKDFL